MIILIISLMCADNVDINITTQELTYQEAVEAIEEGEQYATQEDCDQATYTWTSAENGTRLGYTRFNRFADGSWQVCVPTDDNQESCGAAQWGNDIDD